MADLAEKVREVLDKASNEATIIINDGNILTVCHADRF